MSLHFPCIIASSRLPRALLCAMLCTVVVTTVALPASASEMRRSPVVKALEGVSPAVVNIQGQKLISRNDGVGPEHPMREVNGMGSGVVIDRRGYILTNFHVVDGVQRIQVSLADKRSFIGKLVANDPKTDLAVLKITSDTDLPVVRLGTSSDLMIGEPALAVGNPYGYNHTVSEGIISALNRNVPVSDSQRYYDLIQTSAPINPGNSGGPLINIDGEMIGVVTAVRVGAQGIGFAIPVDIAVEVAAKLIDAEKIDSTYTGIVGRTKFENAKPSFVVGTIASESPASKAGLKEGDVLTAVGSRPVVRNLDLELALLGSKPGDNQELTVMRDGKQVKLTMAMAGTPQQLATETPEDRTWTMLGLKVDVISADQFRQFNSRYRGGLTIMDVRDDGPAAKQGIRRGDVLVGMHIWETVTMDNLSYILKRTETEDLGTLKFYILRGGETLYGTLPVSTRKLR